MSAYTKQLRDAQNNIGIRNISGVCADTEQFIAQVNDVTERLMKRGNWFDTEQHGKFCFRGDCIVFPRFVGTILGARFCSPDQTDIKNGWYSIYGRFRGHRWSGDVVMRDDGLSPTHNDVSGNTGKYIRYHVVKNTDYGKTITLFGKQYGGQPLQTKTNGVWGMGITLTAQKPTAQSSQLVTEIESIVRQPTEGMAYLFEYDPATGLMRSLAVFEPGETHPRRRKMHVEGCQSAPCSTDQNGQQRRVVEAMYKLEFVPVVNPSDFLLISDFAALKLGIQAYKAEEANDDQLAATKWAAAISELNFDTRNKLPDDQFVVHVNYMGAGVVVRNPI